MKRVPPGLHLRRGDAIGLLEHRGEMCQRLESDPVGDFGDGAGLGLEQMPGPLQAEMPNKLGRGLVRHGPQTPLQLPAAHPGQIGQMVHAQVDLAEVCFDQGRDALKKPVVCRSHLYRAGSELEVLLIQLAQARQSRPDYLVLCTRRIDIGLRCAYFFSLYGTRQ